MIFKKQNCLSTAASACGSIPVDRHLRTESFLYKSRSVQEYLRMEVSQLLSLKPIIA